MLRGSICFYLQGLCRRFLGRSDLAKCLPASACILNRFNTAFLRVSDVLKRFNTEILKARETARAVPTAPSLFPRLF